MVEDGGGSSFTNSQCGSQLSVGRVLTIVIIGTSNRVRSSRQPSAVRALSIAITLSSNRVRSSRQGSLYSHHSK